MLCYAQGLPTFVFFRPTAEGRLAEVHRIEGMCTEGGSASGSPWQEYQPWPHARRSRSALPGGHRPSGGNFTRPVAALGARRSTVLRRIVGGWTKELRRAREARGAVRPGRVLYHTYTLQRATGRGEARDEARGGPRGLEPPGFGRGTSEAGQGGRRHGGEVTPNAEFIAPELCFPET